MVYENCIYKDSVLCRTISYIIFPLTRKC